MNILLAINKNIPVYQYGGSERIVWWLGKALHKMGHKVTFLAHIQQQCDFARCIQYQPDVSFNQQIPNDIEMVHLHFIPAEMPQKPYIITMHGNTNHKQTFDQNTVYVSQDHAKRHHATCYVYNGIDTDDYSPVQLHNKRKHFHFLAKAAWRKKNIKGAIKIAKQTQTPLEVIGGTRLNFNMGFRFTLDFNSHFHGMLGGIEKDQIMQPSRGLLFPVIWPEPFGIALIESLYFGCPVFATPYGSLTELIHQDVGFLSTSSSKTIEHIKNDYHYQPQHCHEYVGDQFTAQQMAANYLSLYEKSINKIKLNSEAPYYTPEQDEKNYTFT